MADDQSFRGRKKRKRPSAVEALRDAYKILEKGSQKSKRKPSYYEFSSDPVTGIRNCKNTYSSAKYESQAKKVGCDDHSNSSEGALLDTASGSGIDELPSETWKGDMENVLIEAKELLSKHWTNKTCWQSWGERMTSSNESWENCRSSLVETLIKSKHRVQDVSCQVCKLNTPAVIRCEECGPKQHMCNNCDALVHKTLPFHDRQAAIDGHYQPISSTIVLDSTNSNLINVDRFLPSGVISCPDCNTICQPVENSESAGQVIFISLKGRFDIGHITFKCHYCNKQHSSSSPETVIQLGYWPGSIKNISYIFDTNLFSLWHEIKGFVPVISEGSFLKSLEQISRQNGRVGIINRTPFKTAFKEWKFCQYEIDQLRHLNWMHCPACNEKQHSIHVDGNMKLYRFKSAGTRKRDCYYNDSFIAPNEKVDEHINKVYKGSKGNNDKGDSKCGDTSWRAAANTLQKKKNLVETGLEIAGCRHALAQKAVNMFHGEVYGYAHFMQVNYFIPKDIEFFWYDVVCKYWPWLEKHDKTNYHKMKPALSVFHAKAHSWFCQCLWGGRWQQGACGTTGEEVELINSHFSRLGSTTKHMLPEGREEILTEHAFHWNRRKIENLSNALLDRFKKIEKQLTKARTELQTQMEKFSLRLSNADTYACSWKKDVLKVAQEAQDMLYHKTEKTTPDEESYLSHILTSSDERDQTLLKAASKMYGSKITNLIPKPCCDLVAGETLLKTKVSLHIRKCLENSHHSITQMASNMNKLADSSKQRKNLRNKMSKEKTYLKEMTNLLNGFSDEMLLVEDAEKGEFYWQREDMASNEIPIRTKRLIVDKCMDIERFEEELIQIRKEMVSFIKFYTNDVLTSLRKQLLELEDIPKTTIGTASNTTVPLEQVKQFRYVTPSVDPKVIDGKKALTIQGINYAMQQIATGIATFASVLPIDLDQFHEIPLFPKMMIESDEENENEDEQDDMDEDEDELGEVDAQRRQPVDVILHANIGDVLSECLAPGVCFWRFPLDASQSRWKGRNGSNACSTISLLLGYFIQTKSIPIPMCHSYPTELPAELIGAVCGCIELGNDIYDMCRESLPSRYLSIEEAATAIHSWYPCTLNDPLPVRLVDSHETSTLHCQLTMATANAENSSACIIINRDLKHRRRMRRRQRTGSNYALLFSIAHARKDLPRCPLAVDNHISGKISSSGERSLRLEKNMATELPVAKQSKAKWEWTEEHDKCLCREILVLEPWKYTKRSTKRGEIWREISSNLNALKMPTFVTTDRSVRDRFSLIQSKYKAKIRIEERASGIDCEQTELDRAIAEIIDKEEEAEREKNKEDQTKKGEKDKATAEKVRVKAMETLGKRNASSNDEATETKQSKKRKSSSDAVEYLREKFEAEKELRKEELEIKKNEQNMMMAQMQMMQQQTNAMLSLLAKKL